MIGVDSAIRPMSVILGLQYGTAANSCSKFRHGQLAGADSPAFCKSISDDKNSIDTAKGRQTFEDSRSYKEFPMLGKLQSPAADH